MPVNVKLLFYFQALPQVTVVTGCLAENSSDITVVTTADMADEPKQVVFSSPTESHPLIPGKPHWANYVKGVVQTFKSNSNFWFR